MAKKYTPSGYQIIDISDIDISVWNDTEIDYSSHDDLKVLVECFRKPTKPILLKSSIGIGFAVFGLAKIIYTSFEFLDDGTINSGEQITIRYEKVDDVETLYGTFVQI